MNGKEVICINAKNIPAEIPNHPNEGKVYTVRRAYVNENGHWGLYLNEVVNPPIRCRTPWGEGTYKFEPNFSAQRFTDLLGQPVDVEEEIREVVEERKAA